MNIQNYTRLVADEGKVLRNKEDGTLAYTVETPANNVDKWEEIEDTENKENKIVGE